MGLIIFVTQSWVYKIEIRLWFGTLHNTKNDLVSNQIVSLPKNHRMHIQLCKKHLCIKIKIKRGTYLQWIPCHKHRNSWHGITPFLLLAFCLHSLFSINIFIISSLFSLFIVHISIQTYGNNTLHLYSH